MLWRFNPSHFSYSRCATSPTVPGSIPGGVTLDFFRGSFRQNHVPWGRLSLWKWVPGISPGVKVAGAYGWRPTTLIVLKVEKIRFFNLPGTPRAPSACRRTPLLYLLTQQTAGKHFFPICTNTDHMCNQYYVQISYKGNFRMLNSRKKYSTWYRVHFQQSVSSVSAKLLYSNKQDKLALFQWNKVGTPGSDTDLITMYNLRFRLSLSY